MHSSEPRDKVEEAEEVQRKGLRKMAAFALLFLMWQLAYFTIFPDPGEDVRRVDVVRTFAFLGWVIALLALFATGGAMLRWSKLRTFMDDERAAALRASAYRLGFWVMIGMCIFGYVAALWLDIRATDVVHLVLSAGVLAVLAAHVALERQIA